MTPLLPKGLLMVGAGGIGSEVAHILIQTYTGRLVIVDMDVIEVSNLNRQAFFAEHHVNRHKAEVLAEAITKQSSGRIAAAYHTASIAESRFTADFFSEFDCVLSCVDNIEAREHINTMAVISNTPVIESGSSGYNGQVYITLPQVTECYACTEAQPVKTFPICTLRGVPTEWHHCIHWAKYDFIPRVKEALRENSSAPMEEKHEIIKIAMLQYSIEIDTETIQEIIHTEEESIDTLHKVSAIRAEMYKIKVPPIEETREIVKKTIPSVITTNTIVAAVIVLQLKLLAHKKVHNVYYVSSQHPITKVQAAKPSPLCPLCSLSRHILRAKNTDTLRDLLEAANIKIERETVILKNSSLLYDEEYADLLDTPLKELDVKTGALLKVSSKDEKHLLYVITRE
ncbi:ubiquitin-like 1-activating enzyme E1 B [Nematocida minor]|uniref:ubiquitin-like 1-activating enzyme E1 B n=1 Tax=Nematocida minor TaxID=1912983 RepID=UPI00222111C6|nr:ubiquitin-like 1-activating enzyme E1 B [Nematocida minor]KAI5191235.1 ubiquitin-like 1-activating enzyme E1 B [Nematocida minor]